MSARDDRPLVVLGSGAIAWGRPSGAAAFGTSWSTGRFRDEIVLPRAGGHRFNEEPGSEPWMRLADEIERQASKRQPVPAVPKLRRKLKVKIEAVRDGSSPPLLPSFQILARAQARWVTEQLGVGVVAAPGPWLDPACSRGRELLASWVEQGWRLVALEEALRAGFPDRAAGSFVAGGSHWLRLFPPRDEQRVELNGPYAEQAFDVGEWILDDVLDQMEPSLGADWVRRWREEEEPESGWLTRQHLMQGIVRAQQRGESVAVFDPPLFRFSTSDAQSQLAALARLRVRASLPAARPPAAWWDRGIDWGDAVAFLKGTAAGELEGVVADQGLKVAHVDPSALNEVRSRGVDPTAKVAELVDKGVANRARATTPRRAPEPKAPETVKTPASTFTLAPDEPDVPDEPPPLDVPPAVKPDLPRYDPRRLIVDLPHQPGQLRVLIDGEAVAAESVRLTERPVNASIYRLDGVEVGHGAVVRVLVDAILEPVVLGRGTP